MAALGDDAAEDGIEKYRADRRENHPWNGGGQKRQCRDVQRGRQHQPGAGGSHGAGNDEAELSKWPAGCDGARRRAEYHGDQHVPHGAVSYTHLDVYKRQIL